MKIGMSRVARPVAAFAALAAAAYFLYSFGLSRGHESTGETSQVGGQPVRAGDVDPATGRRVLYWHDPMFPGRRFDAPGRSPFMNMQLVPVYEGESDSEAIAVSPRIRQSLGIRTGQVTRQTLSPRVDAVGTVAFNEREQVVVQARATAYVEALHVRATLDRVSRGQPLADLYVPDWVAVQEEFLTVRRLSGAEVTMLVDAARQRLRQAGMSEEQIRGVETRGSVQPRIALTAPIDGVVTELAAREGMTVVSGQTLFRINGLATVWVNVAVPESQAALLRPGVPAIGRSLALPGTQFTGSVAAILPHVDPVTRTINARIELDNPDLQLVPGTFVNVSIETAPRDALVVPTEAVIRTGTRAVVILAEGDGEFRPVDVEPGVESNGKTEVTHGLEAGQSIVVSGQFLLDSEANLRATSARMQEMPADDTALREHTGEGRVVGFDDGAVTLAHGPIPSLDWGSMTMRFALPPGPRPELVLDEQVRFWFTMGADGVPRLTEIQPIERGR